MIHHYLHVWLGPCNSEMTYLVWSVTYQCSRAQCAPPPSPSMELPLVEDGNLPLVIALSGISRCKCVATLQHDAWWSPKVQSTQEDTSPLTQKIAFRLVLVVPQYQTVWSGSFNMSRIISFCHNPNTTSTQPQEIQNKLGFENWKVRWNYEGHRP